MEQLRKRAFAHKKWMIPLILSSVFNGAVLIGQAYCFVWIVNEIFLEKGDFKTVLPVFFILLGFLLFRVVTLFSSRRSGIKLGTAVKKEIRRELVQTYADHPLQASLSGQTGKKTSILLDAVDEVDQYYSFYIPQVIQTAIVPVFILAAVFSQHLFSGLLMMITAPFFPIYMIVIGLKTQKKADKQMEKMTAFSGHFLDVLQGLVTLKLMGKAKQQKEAIRQKSFAFRDATMDVLKTAFASSLALEFIAMLSVGLIAFELGLQLVVFQNVSFFAAFFILILAPDFYLALRDLGSAFHAGRGSSGAASKISEELNARARLQAWGESGLLDSSPPEIKLEHVDFVYESGPFSLEGLNLTVHPREKLAVIGPNGSGKTTLLRLLSGLIEPSSGTIHINGKPRNSYLEKEWFSKLSYISQNPYLFSGTIRENISLGAEHDVTESELHAAAEKAGLLELVQSLESGFETEIGEGGRGLSGGEKQRIALARAFIKKPSIILFDEPTVGLDLSTEQILQASIKELSRHASMITVAHRLYTIKEADTIVYLDSGKVLAAGTHHHLLKTVPAYRKMMDNQKGALVT
ncbi:thiol reductant ABC exporter subunit CydD [Bacillus mangrovi]|uniref:Thiol reductant ABC exporter subunit CydD n=1 Tax=Metabacillus mangrovi TaxID=1491830 RepID=A0A7X2S2S2_9BACI|nr:thiol reductant ABC exporter subunit CydD [Metabacillus mangrovi]MTH52151.1 thiol reductant ABC exporter subunit CydD [Metabacillus mangrovi]